MNCYIPLLRSVSSYDRTQFSNCLFLEKGAFSSTRIFAISENPVVVDIVYLSPSTPEHVPLVTLGSRTVHL